MDRLDGPACSNIDNVMRHLHLEAGVDGIISALDAPQSKPDPGCFLKAMEIEGAAPDVKRSSSKLPPKGIRPSASNAATPQRASD